MQSFNVAPFFLLKISNKMAYYVLGSSSKAMADREKKRGSTTIELMEIQQFEYLENEKRFLDEIKNIFHSF